MKLVAYRRTSGDQKESTSLESQQVKIQAKCVVDDHELIADFFDKESAENAVNRLGFIQALELIYSGKADGLIVWKLDRFARSVRDGVSILSEFKRLGKSLVCCADPIDTTTAMGEAFFQIALVFAELERKTIAERCESGRLARGAQLRYAGGAAPYGWNATRDGDKKILVANPTEQTVLERIRTMRDEEGMSYRKIAETLTAEGIPPPYVNRKAKTSHWNNCTVRAIYLGERELVKWILSGQSYDYSAKTSRL